MDIPQTLVIDFGSYETRIGLSTSPTPELVISSYYPSHDPDYLLISKIMDRMEITQSIKEGEINSIDRALFVFTSEANALFSNETGNNFIFSDAPNTSIEIIDTFTQMLFEDCGANAICFKPPGLAVLQDQHCLTGICLDRGYQLTDCVPKALTTIPMHCIKTSRLSGFSVDCYCRRMLNFSMDKLSWGDFKKIEEIKKSSPLSPEELDPAKLENSTNDQFVSQTSNEILFGKDWLLAAFPKGAPNVQVDRMIEESTLPTLVKNTIDSCDIDLRNDLWRKIFVIGGSANIPGLHERLTSELTQITPPSITPNVQILKEPELAGWRALAKTEMTKGEPFVLTAEEYFEDTTNAAAKKFRDVSLRKEAL